nr:uncharacterized protein LOC125994445 [Syngnathus scovelli]XP_049620140.1 uncharacterized protein LOC125994731 isoform X1 [Syngnathus scovelli]
MDHPNLTSTESDFLANIDEIDLPSFSGPSQRSDTPELDLSNANNVCTSQITDLLNNVSTALSEGERPDSPAILTHLQAVIDELNNQSMNEGRQSPTQIPSQLLNMIAELNNQANGNNGRISPDIPVQLLNMIQNLNTQPLVDPLTANTVDSSSFAVDDVQPIFQPNNCSVIIDHEIDVIDNNTPAFQHTPQQSNNGSVLADQHGGSIVINRPHFNNVEVRRRLNIPSQQNINDFATFYLQIEDKIDDVVQEVASRAQTGDVIQIELAAGNDRAHIYQQTSDINSIRDNVSNLLERLAQSNTELLADEGLELIVQIVTPLRGGGGMRRRLLNTTNREILRLKKRHLHIPRNTDNKLCFALSLTYLLNDTLTTKQATRHARLLHESVGLDCQTPVSLGDVHKFEKVLKRKITVMYRKEDCRPMTFFDTRYPKTDNDTLFVLNLEGHFYGVKAIEAFVGHAFFCRHCYKGHENWQQHHCEGHCGVCLDPCCKQRRFKHVICPDCNKSCRNEECFTKHKESRSMNRVSNCTSYKKCLECGLQYYVRADGTGAKHRCPVKKCTVCDEIINQDDALLNPHMCYIQPIKPQPPCKNVVYYDFETYVDSDGLHKPFLICCESNNGLAKHWYGTDCVDEFLRFFRRPRFKQTTFVAHNARGFDSYILIRRMLELGLKLDILMQGSKVLSFVDLDTKSRFIDSLSFLTMPLSAMPKALGFEDKSKGYFPHKFSSLEHLNYVGSHPDPTYYGTERMSPSQRSKFDEWYAKEASNVFDFAKQAIAYCKNDVDLLMQGCEKFRSEFFEATGTDPFNAVTIASACMKVFRANFLTPQTLAITPSDNYMRQYKAFSHDSIQYMQWIMHSQNIQIRHALNGGEVRIDNYFVDGYCEIGGVKIVFEYFGCYHHGCAECFDLSKICPTTKRPFQERFDKTQKKIQDLQLRQDVYLVIMWEHEWLQMKKMDIEVKEFLKKNKFPTPLKPRQALFGGRTNAFVLKYTAEPDERVLYVDVTSLYPFINSTATYPIDHPTIIHDDFKDPRSYFGFISATVNPPRGLYFPVLPFKTAKGKLVFTLCRTCAECNNQQTACTHSDEQRSLTGVWTTPEFVKALDLGYTVAEITEVWHYTRTSDTIFRDYMRTFLKGKQESSGYPPHVVNQADRERYIEGYAIHQGIQLDPSKIAVNPGKRQVSKLCLNNLWGKLAQRDNMTNTKIVTKSEDFFELLFSGLYNVKFFHFINEKLSIVQYCININNEIPASKTSNVAAACFTTAYARLKMYSYLEILQKRVLYTDTDSLVYTVKPGESVLALGDYLGDLTDELSNDSILEFVSAGPKTYAYKTRGSSQTVMKVKGITQSHESGQSINLDSMLSLVQGYIDTAGATSDVLYAPQHNIVRDKRGFHLRNVSFSKRLRVVYDKRRLLERGTTEPFGY